MKDHSILEALSASLDDQQDRHLGSASSASEATHFNATQHFSAFYEGKARQIAQITDTRIHQRMEHWCNGQTAARHGLALRIEQRSARPRSRASATRTGCSGRSGCQVGIQEPETMSQVDFAKCIVHTTRQKATGAQEETEEERSR